jgi:hypothetical protein
MNPDPSSLPSVGIVPLTPEVIKSLNLNEEPKVKERIGTVHFLLAGKRIKRPVNGDLIFASGAKTVVVCSDNNTQIPVDEIIKLAHTIQKDTIKEAINRDSEGIDHLLLAKEILSPSEEQPNIIQVLDGTDHPDFSSFPGNNAESLRITIHYIEANNLQETAPWSAIWNLWKCLEAVANEKV